MEHFKGTFHEGANDAIREDMSMKMDLLDQLKKSLIAQKQAVATGVVKDSTFEKDFEHFMLFWNRLNDPKTVLLVQDGMMIEKLLRKYTTHK